MISTFPPGMQESENKSIRLNQIIEKANNDIANRELSITRMLSAPIDLVWEVWTNPDHIANWLGTKRIYQHNS